MPPRRDSHESFDREETVGSTDRGFGQVFAAVFALVGGIKLWIGNPWFWPWFVAAFLVLVVAYARPALLAPFNRLWTRFGLLLFRVVNPVVMGILFFLTVVPIGLIMRAAGKDMLRLRLDPAAGSYWIRRDPPGPAPDSMKHQF